MPSPLCILYLEDNPSDAELVALQLKRDGFEADIRRVETRADFEAALSGRIDLILADYSVPSFTGLDAIHLLRERGIDIPVILISGTIGEEEAVEAMKAGAFDYLLKGRLARLGVAMSNALQEERLRAEKRTAENALRSSEERYRILFESNPMPMWVYSTATLRFLAVNDAAVEHYGYTREEFLSMTIEDIRPAEELSRLKLNLEKSAERRQQSSPWKHRRKDGTLISVEILSYHLDTADGSSRLVLANDITEKQRAEDALRDSEERFRLLFATSPDAIMLLDMDDPHKRLPIVDCNEVACRMHGYTREELLGQPISFLEASHDDIAALDDWVSREISQKGVARLETLHRHKDGHLFPVEVSISRLSAGGRNLSLSIERDITERKRAEERLHLSDQILQRVKALVLVADENAQVIYVSPSVNDMLGYEPEELLGDGWWRLSRTETAEAEKNKELLRRIARGEQELSNAPYEREIRTRSGETRWLTWQDAFGPNRTLVGVGHDITERKQAEEALLRSEIKYRNLVETSHDLIWAVDAEGRITYLNQAAKHIYGYEPEELLGHSFLELMDRAHDPTDVHLFKKNIANMDKSLGTESIVRHKDGTRRILSANSVVIRDNQNNVLGLIGSSRDITERKQAEEALREAESRYRTLIEQLPMVVYVTSADKDARTSYISPQIEAMLGYKVEEWLADSRRWEKTLYPGDRPAVLEKIEAIGRSGEPYEMEYRMVARDGQVVWFQDRAILIRNSEGVPLFWQGLMIDITERKQTEEKLKQRDAELQRRNSELERLYRSSESLLVGALADLPTLAQNIVETLLREFEQSNCSLLLVNKETRELERIAVAGPYAEYVSRAKLSLDKPGLVARAVSSGRVMNVADVSANPDYVPNWEHARSELVIPLKVAEDVIGALDVQSPELDAFHADDERLMTIFAERAAFGLERTRLHEQTHLQLERLESLRTIDLAISNSLDLKISLNIVLEQVIQQLGVDAASVLLLKPGLGRLEYFVGRGFRTREIESTSLRMGEGYAGRAAMEKQIVHATDLGSHSSEPSRRGTFRSEEFVSYFGVPLIARGEVKGVLEIFHRKPIRADMEWLNFLDSLGWQTAIAVDNAILFEGVQRSNFELAMAYDETIEGWSRALDLRDKETEGHTRRVTEMTLKLAEAMAFHGEDLAHIRRGALLHDIGKMGVPDHILLKPDALNDEEWASMKRHPQFAFEMLQPIAYLRPALHIPYCHHEKWDGTGYPRGLAGMQIPLEARLFAVVDVWDALTSDRPYRKKWPKGKALKYIREQSGKHFDPQVVEKFLQEMLGQL